MWQWQHDQVNEHSLGLRSISDQNVTDVIRVTAFVLLQLDRPPTVPLKRKRRYCEFWDLVPLSSAPVAESMR